MDSAASRVERVLIGFAVPLYLLTALAFAEGRISLLSEPGPNEDLWAVLFGSLAVLASLLYAYIPTSEASSMGRPGLTVCSAVNLRRRCSSG
ncbi:MAG: hypothetical protein CM1200mP32_10810 [Methanobacteriota archaeon]|nr:MAG: hypothetical protein CM1200mP32_10810 [Euryarchaeota archaeon]